MDANLVSLFAAVLSAVFGVVSGVAAYKSAIAAKRAQESSDEAERRGVLRNLVVTAREVEVESARSCEVAEKAGRSRNDLAVFTGNVGGPRSKSDQEGYSAKSTRASEIGREAKLFSTWPSVLEKAPLEEIDRVLAKLLALRSEVTAIRQSLESSHADLERQNDTFRNRGVAKWNQ